MQCNLCRNHRATFPDPRAPLGDRILCESCYSVEVEYYLEHRVVELLSEIESLTCQMKEKAYLRTMLRAMMTD